MNNPFQMLLAGADNIQRALADDTTTMSLALEQRMVAVQAHQEAKQAYEEAEAEFKFEFMFSDEAYGKAKVADAKLILDRAIIAARGSGPLAQPWRILNAAKNDLDNAQMAYDQAEARFKAVRVAAELQGAMLLGLAADAKLLRG